MRQILSIISIDYLDLRPGGADELSAIDALKEVVLQNPGQANQVFLELKRFCLNLAKTRSGADRGTFQRELLRHNIALKVSPSYRQDIDQLREYTRSTIKRLHHLSVLSMGQTDIKITRPCVDQLIQNTVDNHLLVVGEPGSGKSGVLHDVASKLIESEKDVVLLAADYIEARNSAQLKEELNLQHDMVTVLENWPALSPGFVLIDALDATRSDASAKELHSLIRRIVQADSRWRVIATIRKFDLRYRQELQNMFRGKPVSHPEPDPEFLNVGHMNVHQLDNGEMEQVKNQSKDIAHLLRLAEEYPDPTLRQLLCQPFNLRLAADLLSGGACPDELTPVRSQVELLDRYWLRRVITADGQSDTREALLRRICEEMVKRQSLRVDRTSVTDSAPSALQSLLTNNVLMEWSGTSGSRPNRYILAFSHHVLFDYAVARMLFRGSEEKLENRITSEPHIALTIRPSLSFHFRHLWLEDELRSQFWDQTLRLLKNTKVPQIAKLLGPSVTVEMARNMSGFDGLFKALVSLDSETKTAAEEAVAHIAGALLATNVSIVGKTDSLWSEWLATTAERNTPGTAGAVRVLLLHSLDKLDTGSHEQMKWIGKAARTQMAYSLDNPQKYSGLLPVAISAVCRTFDTDIPTSEGLIERVLDCNVVELRIKGIGWLAREIDRLFLNASELTRQIYSSVFRLPEPEDKIVPMWDSQIVGLTSTLKQDFNSSKHQLATSFGKFLHASYRDAVPVLVEVVKHYVDEKRTRSEALSEL